MNKLGRKQRIYPILLITKCKNDMPCKGQIRILILFSVFVQRTWKILRAHLTKPGCVLVTVPSLEEATIFNSKVCCC